MQGRSFYSLQLTMRCNKNISFLFVLLGLLAAGRAALAEGIPAKVAEIISGHEVRLENGGNLILADIWAPLAGQPLYQESKNVLAALVKDKNLQLIRAAESQNRHGAVKGELYHNGHSITEVMLNQGWARLYPVDIYYYPKKLLALENSARQEKRGIWQNEFYAIHSATTIKAANPPRFEMVEGKVIGIFQKKGQDAYLDFGQDWKNDFSARIPQISQKFFTRGKMRIEELAGKNLRLRGWVFEKNGPMMEITTPAQIEILP